MATPRPHNLTAAIAATFAAVAVTYVVLLLAVKYIAGANSSLLFGGVVADCMICALVGLAVLRAFAVKWSLGIFAAYAVGGLVLIAAAAALANALAGDGTVIRLEALLATIVLQWVAFVVPAWAYGKRLLARADPA